MRFRGFRASSLSVVLAVVACRGNGGEFTDAAESGSLDVIAPDAATSCAPATDPQPSVTVAPVSHAHPPTESTFEGFSVVSYVPASPVGLVFVFHGTGGSATFAHKLESVEVLNALEAAGYAWIVTESTERTGNRRWDVAPVASNPDIQRLVRLHSLIVDQSAVEPGTPVFSLGMSNGAVFSASFAYFLARQTTIPIRAAAMYESAFADAAFPPVRPIFHLRVTNDGTADTARMTTQLAALRAAGSPVLVSHEAAEVALSSARFQRIPGVLAPKAQEIFDELVRIGLIDGNGRRLVDQTTAEGIFPQFSVSGLSADQRGGVQDEVLAAFAMHQMRADYRIQTVAFFDCFR